MLISQWIGNHIALHLRHVLKNPSIHHKTKNGTSILGGYDVNSEYVKDVDGEFKDQFDEDDPRNAHNRTKLIVSPHETPPNWAEIPFLDYGYASFDPTTRTFNMIKEEYDEKLERHKKWAQLCGVNENDALNQELQHRDQFKALDGAGEKLELIGQDPTKAKQLLLGGGSDHNGQINTQTDPLQLTTINTEPQTANLDAMDLEFIKTLKLKDMSVPQQTKYIRHFVKSLFFGTFKALFTITARTTQLLTPGGAKAIWKELRENDVGGVVMRKVYGIFRFFSVGLIRGLKSIHTTIDNKLQSKIPFINRFIRRRVDAVADNLVDIGTPILDTMNNRIDQVNRVAKWSDEWFGTTYSEKEGIKKLNDMRKLEVLLELSPHPGPAPTPPKASPYQDPAPPVKMFEMIGVDKNGGTMEDVLHAAEIDDHRLLLSYIHRTRNTTPITVGLCPDEINIPEEFFKPRLNKSGMLEVPLASHPTTPELALLQIDHPTLYEQAGLRKSPDIWLSKRILDKTPSPDMLDLAQTIHKIDPTFTIPRSIKKSAALKTNKTDDNDGFTWGDLWKGMGTGLVIGTVGYEGYLIANELQTAFAQFPDTPKDALLQDYAKFYLLRMQYSTTALLDTAWHGITNKHLWSEYDDNSVKQLQDEHYYGDASGSNDPLAGRRQRKVFSQQELEELLRTVEQQLQQDKTTTPDGQSPEFTIISADQANALMQLSKQYQDGAMQLGGGGGNGGNGGQVFALSSNHSPNIPHISTQQPPMHFQTLSQEEIDGIKGE